MTVRNPRYSDHSRWRELVRLELRLSWASTSPAGFVLGSCQIALLDDFLVHVVPGTQEFQAFLSQLDGPLFQLAEATTRCRYILGLESRYYAPRVPEIQDALPSLMPKMYYKGITAVEVIAQSED